MNANVLRNCDIFAHNIETAAKAYKWDGSYSATAFAASVAASSAASSSC